MNPFEPTFGRTPPLLVGRDQPIELFGESLDRVGGAALATVITGARGTGKTVLLNALEDTARSRGWIVLSETSTPGIEHRLIHDRLGPLVDDLTDDEAPQLRSVSAVGFSASWDDVDEPSPYRPGLRPLLEQVTDRLAATGTGLMISIDEIQRHAFDDLRSITTAVQHAFRENRPVALAAAGLPSAVSDLLNDDILTFLRRAHRVEVGRVTPADTAAALADPLAAADRTITQDALAAAVDATRGYPFLIQLVGDELYRSTGDGTIDGTDAARAIPAAQDRLGQLVHAPALADLSKTDRAFLYAMADDDGPSRMGDLAQRLNVDANYAGQYRLRLIAADLIHSTGRGTVDFELPYLRNYLRSTPRIT